MELIAALEAFESEMRIPQPRGANNLPPRVRYRAILALLRNRLCPHLSKSTDILKLEQATLIAAISDAILLYVATLEVPAISIARSIAIVGIENFCKDPSSILPET